MPNSQKLSKLKKYYEITLETITPVHVGSGEEYINGLDFIGDIFFDINRLMREASTDSKMMNNLCNEIEKGNLRNFYNSNRELFSKISEKKSIPNSISGQNIKKHIKTNGKIYLPGSSIKGAIRTAIAAHYAFGENERNRQNSINYFNEEKKEKVNQKTADQNLMNSIFGRDPKENLMRILSVTDSEILNSSKIYEMRILGSSSMRDTKLFYEMIPDKTKIKCNLSIDEFLSFEEHRQKAQIPKKAFSFENIVDMLNTDSGEQINQNVEFNNDNIVEFYNNIGDIYTKLASNEALFNLGAGIGWIGTTGNLIGEEMTESIRKNLKLAPHRLNFNFPKTRRVVDMNGEQIPPGWVKMTFKEI
ncbi:MAG TPA: type III-A CRISPR-associated RAMP protein Csm5 [bacterium]|nr:type III-A CRISPR-associated RAMP protein Csm5 [bacterium]